MENIVDNMLYNGQIPILQKKNKFHYFKQLVNLSATCFHVKLEQFLACFCVAQVCQWLLVLVITSEIYTKNIALLLINPRNNTHVLLPVFRQKRDHRHTKQPFLSCSTSTITMTSPKTAVMYCSSSRPLSHTADTLRIITTSHVKFFHT